MMPHNLPPWHAVYEQTQRWLAAGCLEQLMHDLRVLIRLGDQRVPRPSAVIIDSRTLQSTPESAGRAGDDGAKRRKGSKVHMVVDTRGELLLVTVTPANEQDRAQVADLVLRVQEVTGEQVAFAFVDQGYTGREPARAAAADGVRLEVVKRPKIKRGFMLPWRWMAERSFSWMACFRRLACIVWHLPV
jgi:transposase